MFDKLNFTEVIRYFFSGLIVAGGVMFVCGISADKVIKWAEQHQWAATFSPGIAAASVVLLVGYVCFIVYRSIVYDHVVLYLHAFLARKWRPFFSHKELIRNILLKKGYRVSTAEVERIYRVVRGKVAKDFYDRAAPRISAGIHLLYLSVVVAFISVLWTHKWMGLVPVLAAFALVVFMDVHYMREELLMFIQEQAKLERELDILMANPAWRRT